MKIVMEPSRLKPLIQAAVVVALTLSLVDCGRFSLSSEERINTAFPQPVILTAQIKGALDALSGEQRSHIRDELASRLKLRALTCAKGYSPSWGAAPEEVRRNITDHSCFTGFDDDVGRWLGIVRIGPLLKAPALAPLPKGGKIHSKAFIQGADFARNAGVVLLEHQTSLEIVDMNSSATILQIEKKNGFVGRLSPNGRLFTAGKEGTLEVRLVQDGSLVAELPMTRAYKFYWVDDQTAVYKGEDGRVAKLIDFSSAKEVELPDVEGLTGVLPVPGQPDQFVAGHYNGASKFEIDRSAAQPQVRRLQRTEDSAFSSWSSNASSLTTDGKHYVSHNGSLQILALDSLQLETLDLGPYRLQKVIGTWDPDLVYISGFMTLQSGKSGHCYLYSIANRTFSSIGCDTFSMRPIFIPSLKKLGFIEDSAISVIVGISSRPPVTHLDQVLAWHEEASQSRQAALETSSVWPGYGRSSDATAPRTIADARTPPASSSEVFNVLYKCELPGGKVVFQSTSCLQGREVQRLEIKKDLNNNPKADATSRFRAQQKLRWPGAPSAPGAGAARSAATPAYSTTTPEQPEFRYVPPRVTEPEAAPPPAPAAPGQRCPYTPIKGDDITLQVEKMRMYAELFYVDPWKDSVAALGAPSADEDRRDEVARRERCDVLINEYQEVGDELRRVYPKSLSSVRSCFQREAQRLDAEGRRLRCKIERR